MIVCFLIKETIQTRIMVTEYLPSNIILIIIKLNMGCSFLILSFAEVHLEKNWGELSGCY